MEAIFFSRTTSLWNTRVGSSTGCMLLSTLCASMFDQPSCPVCLISQLRYVAGLQTEHVLAWLKLSAALHLPLRILCNVEGGQVGVGTHWRDAATQETSWVTERWFVSVQMKRLKILQSRRGKQGCFLGFMSFVKHYITWKVLHKSAIMILRDVLM